MDRQSQAFREMTLEDEWNGQLDSLEADAIHMPTEDLERIYPPEYFEQEEAPWDAERSAPKTKEEASEVLESRIDDPSAPDDAGDILFYYDSPDSTGPIA